MGFAKMASIPTTPRQPFAHCHAIWVVPIWQQRQLFPLPLINLAMIQIRELFYFLFHKLNNKLKFKFPIKFYFF
jgi:hypothetical protein